MVDLSGGQDGPIEHGFSNTVFIIPGIIFITLSAYVFVSLICVSVGFNTNSMDLLQGINDMDHEDAQAQAEDIVNNVDMGNMKMPTVEELLQALDGMTGMSDEDKQSLRDQLSGQGGQPFGGPPPQQSSYQQMIILFSLLLLVGCIFVFFGYKLYKSLVDKERKRDEKRKMKQMKKKK